MGTENGTGRGVGSRNRNGKMQFMLSTASFLDFHHFRFPYCKQQKAGWGPGNKTVLSKQVDYI